MEGKLQVGKIYLQITYLTKDLLMSSMCSMEKAMAPQFSTLAWKIPCLEEPGRLQSMGSHRIGHD